MQTEEFQLEISYSKSKAKFLFPTHICCNAGISNDQRAYFIAHTNAAPQFCVATDSSQTRGKRTLASLALNKRALAASFGFIVTRIEFKQLETLSSR
jgi:hypothetical protein